MFHHLLITRFNLKNPEWKLTKNNDTLLDEQWMTERMELFTNYCLPSVINQTNKNFKWLLYFDELTNDYFKNEIRLLTENHQNIEVFYIDGMPSFNESILKYVKENASSEPYIITSRIDNDDCISKYFIDEVQKNFNKQDFLAVDFYQGYTLQIAPQVILGKKDHIFNPFISLIEKNENPKTVWHYAHNMWKKESRTIHVKNKRIWMSVIHEKNKVNEFYGYGNIDWNILSKEFIVSDFINQKIKSELLPFKNWWTKSLKNYLNVKSSVFTKMLKRNIGLYKIK
jgi:hypothetical protein